MTRRLLVVLGVLVVGAVGSIGAAPAFAAGPVWNLEMHHDQTNFPPGGKAQYRLDLNNVGAGPSSGPISLTVHLPAGLTLSRVIVGEEFARSAPVLTWSCTGATTVECHTTAGSIPRHTLAHLTLEVNIGAGLAEGSTLTATATLGGGGASTSVSDSEPVEVSSTPASFGVVASSFAPDFFAADGLTTERQAGAHPNNLAVGIDFNSVDTGKTIPKSGIPLTREVGSVRDLTVDLPPGFLGNPTAVGECTPAQYAVGACPLSSQVGRFDGSVYPPVGLVWDFSTGVFNLSHPRGAVTDLGFEIDSNPVHIRASLDPADHYAILTTLSDINESAPAFSGTVTIWGVPADPSHDSERCPAFASRGGNASNTNEECSTDHEQKPFLTLPSQCETDNVFRLHEYDSWQEKGVFGPEIDYTMPGRLTGCDKSRFEPEVKIEPTGKQANTPTGLEVNIHVPQNDNANGLATPPVRDTRVTLPEGMSFSPSFADGLTSCSLAQMKLGTNDPIECPDSSRIGEVSLRTPLLPDLLEGSVYLASQGDNPFGSTFALYLVIHDTEERGVLVKIPGRIEVDQLTGQITTVFAETPELPFEDLTLKFRSGSRAPLVSPPACGVQTIDGTMSSYAQPDSPVDVSGSYDVTEGPNGTSCPSDAAHRPFAPRMSAGTLNPSAGAYSPFVFRLTREDQEQEMSRVSTVLAPGVTAKLAGIPFCPESAIASISTAEGTGRAQQEHPSCPEASRIGTIDAGVGAGPTPDYFQGNVYLAGAYEGAPFSLVIVVPALAGPYDLGSVVVRAAIFIDPSTAQARVISDPFPTILHGVLLRVRDVRLRVDRPETILNPTSCAPMSIGGVISGVGGAQASVSSPFQVGDCASLAFKPSFNVSTSGKTSKANGASLTVKLAYPKAPQGTQANIHQVKVELPKQLPSRLTTLQKACTAAQFDANPAGCPAASVIGHATAITPILPVPLSGPAYFVSNGGEAFPNLIMVLQGYGITIDLVGDTFISKAGITSSTFKTVPDQPVTSFELTLPQGPYSALTANGNLCTSKLSMPTEFVGQNGAKFNQSTPVSVTGCPKVKVLTRAQKLALALKACHKQHNHAKRKACERQARKKYGPVKKAKKK